MNRLLLVASCAVVLGSAPHPAPAQSPVGAEFEVVSVKPNTSIGEGGFITGFGNPQFRVRNISLRAIIIYAYDLRDVQLVDAPEWTRSARFDISATYPQGADPQTQMRPMLQRVLAERFNLRVRRETRELPMYRLVMARQDRKLGPNLVPSDVDCAKWLAENRPQIIGTPPIGPAGARPACMTVTQRNFILAGTKPMADLARSLESIVARSVVDATALSGNFNIDLEWTPSAGLDAAGNTSAAARDSGLSVFTALQEQLGLKLEPARGPVDALVVESVERPAPD
jgi:uncharacterized protein (TIGR03435 family)